MAKGDIYTDLVSCADAASATIQPAAGRECRVFNIGWSTAGANEAKMEIYKSDASGDRLTLNKDSYTVLSYGYAICPVGIYVTNADYLKVKNVSGASGYIWYDGVELKPAT